MTGRNDFNLLTNSISIIIPQEEFLMLRYYNDQVSYVRISLTSIMTDPIDCR
jgi:hypothetical protein